MKHVIILFILCFLVKTSNAQIPEFNVVHVQSFTKNLPQAKLLYNSDKGKVYSLPLDNMKCLVPDVLYTINENKQYKQDYSPSYIPNALPNIKIIPLQLKVYPSPSR